MQHGLLCIPSVISVVNTHLLSLSFRCLKHRNDAHLHSRCKVRVTRNANINCHYEVRRKEMRPRGKEINLLVCQNAFSFLDLKLISLAYESRVNSCVTRGSCPKRRAIISQRAGYTRQRETNEIIGIEDSRRYAGRRYSERGNEIHHGRGKMSSYISNNSSLT